MSKLKIQIELPLTKDNPPECQFIARLNVLQYVYSYGSTPQEAAGNLLFTNPHLAEIQYTPEALQKIQSRKQVVGLPPHLTDNAPYHSCDTCGRKSYQKFSKPEPCLMRQPSGSLCPGVFV